MTTREWSVIGLIGTALAVYACSSDDGGGGGGTGGATGGSSGTSGAGGSGAGSSGGSGGNDGGGAGGSAGAVGDAANDAPTCATSTSGSGDKVDKTAICQKVVAAGCPKVTQPDCETVFGQFPTSCAGAWNAFIDCAGAAPDWSCVKDDPTPAKCLDIWAACMKPCLPTG